MKKILISFVVLALLGVFCTVKADATCTAAFTTEAKANYLQGVYAYTDTLKMTLHLSASSTYSAASTVYSATGEVTGGGGYTTGGKALTTQAFSVSGTTAYMDADDLVWTSGGAETITADCSVLYDTTADKHTSCTASHAPYYCCTGSGTGCQNELIAIYTYTSMTCSNGGTCTLTLPAAGVNAVVTIAKEMMLDPTNPIEMLAGILVSDEEMLQYTNNILNPSFSPMVASIQ